MFTMRISSDHMSCICMIIDLLDNFSFSAIVALTTGCEKCTMSAFTGTLVNIRLEL